MSSDSVPSGLPASDFPDLASSTVTISPGQARSILRANRADLWAIVGCNLVVFASSVCIMVLELAASRLIAAHLGQSLYSWTSVIGVVLAGISGGNFLGGWLADRFKPEKVLPWLFVAAGLLTLNVLVLNYWASGTEQPAWFSWPVWVMFVVAWIFFFPSVALGTISPVTASIALKRTQKTGVTVGNIYAWGALGSIAGTFLAGFVLIDLFGTRAIVVMTAGTLLTMSLLVAAGQQALRAGVFFGGLPLVMIIGLCASATATGTASSVVTLRTVAGINDSPSPAQALAAWREWGKELGRNLHELGLTLRLREDETNRYYDESNYSQISIGPHRDSETGELYQSLILDALQHSFLDPDDPLKLHYDYELVYAAVTERACNTWNRTTSVPLRQLPVDAGYADMLPEGVRYDPKTKQLTVHGALGLRQFRDLVNTGTQGAYRTAVLQAFSDSRARQGEQSNTPLDRLPIGLSIPTDMGDRVRYDPFFSKLQCDKPLSLADTFRLMALGEQRAYAEDVIRLFSKSRQVRTLFLGGGGFIFPRWIEAFFPDQPLIDVAEIDPAVLHAVEQEMGLPSDPQRTAVRTTIGDARKFVHDQWRNNRVRVAAGQKPIQYDFIYGDAFNHYSVPWHLTTAEFDEKIRDLLDPKEGVYLVNIIDVFPRAEFPHATEIIGQGGGLCLGPLPPTVRPPDLQRDQQWHRAPRPFEKLQIRWSAEDSYEMYVNDPLTTEEFAGLTAASFEGAQDPEEYVAFRDGLAAVKQNATKRKAYLQPLPQQLAATAMMPGLYVPTAEFPNLEICQLEPQKSVLGYRGVMSEDVRTRLKSLAGSDRDWAAAIDSLYADSRQSRTGRFLGRYVRTVRDVFPYVYVFSSNKEGASADRDTFVVACSLKPLNFSHLQEAGDFWPNPPFAWSERDAARSTRDHGQMGAILDHSQGQSLTDDYAPVDNLLSPLFEK